MTRRPRTFPVRLGATDSADQTRTDRSYRWTRVLAVPLVLVLVGCMKLETIVDIASDDDIRVTVGVGMEKEYAEQLEMTSKKLCESMAEDGGEIEDTSDSKYVSCQVSRAGTLADFSTGELSLTREGDIYKFVFGVEGLQEATEQSGGTGMDLSDIYTSLNISVTFPGPVVEYNGNPAVSGNTVSWTDPEDLTLGDGLVATGQAVGGAGEQPTGDALGSIAGPQLAQLTLEALKGSLPAGSADPIIDCGTEEIEVAIGKVVTCELTEASTMDVYEVTVTMTGVEGDILSISATVGDAPLRRGTGAAPGSSGAPATAPSDSFGLAGPLVIGVVVGLIVLAAAVAIVLVVRSSGKKKATAAQHMAYQGSQYPAQGQYPPQSHIPQQSYPGQSPAQYPQTPQAQSAQTQQVQYPQTPQVQYPQTPQAQYPQTPQVQYPNPHYPDQPTHLRTETGQYPSQAQFETQPTRQLPEQQPPAQPQ